MQATITDALTVILACLVIAALACGIFLFRPHKRRHRRHKHGRGRPKIDLFAKRAAAPTSERDA